MGLHDDDDFFKNVNSNQAGPVIRLEDWGVNFFAHVMENQVMVLIWINIPFDYLPWGGKSS